MGYLSDVIMCVVFLARAHSKNYRQVVLGCQHDLDISPPDTKLDITYNYTTLQFDIRIRVVRWHPGGMLTEIQTIKTCLKRDTHSRVVKYFATFIIILNICKNSCMQYVSMSD